MTNYIADQNVRTLLRVDTLLVLGMMLMSNYTSVLRLRRKVFATPEDYALNRIALPEPTHSSSARELEEPIGRARRIHANHLENVLPFLVLSVLYALTEPDHELFAGLPWTFLIARVAYTALYVRGAQPHRTMAFGVGGLIQLALAVLTLSATFTG